MAEDTTRWMAITEEAQSAELEAMRLDREGQSAEAAALYHQVVARLREAALACPMGHPDRPVLETHSNEVLERATYLEELHGVPATVPLEDHIQGVQLTMPSEGGGIAENDWLLVDEDEARPMERKKDVMVASAAIGGLAGLLLLGPVPGLALGVATAYASTREDSAGSAVRKVGKAGVTAVSQVKALDEDYRISQRVASVGHTALDQVSALDQRYSLSDKALHASSQTHGALTGISESRVAATVNQGLSSAASVISGIISKP